MMLAPIDVTDIRIDTERLLLRPWRQEDLEDLYAYAGVDGVGEMAGWRHHKSRAESQNILDLFINEKKTFALEWKESGIVIGSLGLESPNADEFDESALQGRELGYVLSRDYWGRGLMREAVSAVIDYCFCVLGYDFLTCSHFIRNDRSRRVIEKTGFQFVREISYQTQYDTVEPARLYVLYNPNPER